MRPKQTGAALYLPIGPFPAAAASAAAAVEAVEAAAAAAAVARPENPFAVATTTRALIIFLSFIIICSVFIR